MTVSLELTFANMEHSNFVADAVRARVDQLEKIYQGITTCHVVVSNPHKHQRQGNKFEIHIEARVPGEELVVSQKPGDFESHDTFEIALRDAFNAMERQLTSWKEKRRHDVKAHSRPQAPPDFEE